MAVDHFRRPSDRGDEPGAESGDGALDQPLQARHRAEGIDRSVTAHHAFTPPSSTVRKPLWRSGDGSSRPSRRQLPPSRIYHRQPYRQGHSAVGRRRGMQSSGRRKNVQSGGMVRGSMRSACLRFCRQHRRMPDYVGSRRLGIGCRTECTRVLPRRRWEQLPPDPRRQRKPVRTVHVHGEIRGRGRAIRHHAFLIDDRVNGTHHNEQIADRRPVDAGPGLRALARRARRQPAGA